MAGQFAKPRSAPMEVIGDVELPSYRGDIVNGLDFIAADRIPDPARQLQAYSQAAATHQPAARLHPGRLRGPAPACTSGRWAFSTSRRRPIATSDFADRISEALDFMRACGVSDLTTPEITRTSLYTSHEALLLGFEEALTRIDSTSGRWYDTSAHLLWIGDRTRQLDGAHVEYLPRHRQPARRQGRPDHAGRRPAAAVRRAQPGERAGPADRHRAHGRTSRSSGSCRPWSAPSSARAASSSGPAIPCTATRSSRRRGYKTRPFDRDPAPRCGASSPCTGPRARMPAASISR